MQAADILLLLLLLLLRLLLLRLLLLQQLLQNLQVLLDLLLWQLLQLPPASSGRGLLLLLLLLLVQIRPLPLHEACIGLFEIGPVRHCGNEGPGGACTCALARSRAPRSRATCAIEGHIS